MNEHSPHEGERLTFRVSVCSKYNASLSKEENSFRVASGWEVEEVVWNLSEQRSFVI